MLNNLDHRNLKLEKVEENYYLFYCPGCGTRHYISTDTSKKPCWRIDTSNGKLTVTPSILVNGEYRCHLFIKDNKIEYLNDSTHKLRGQTVDMELDD